MADLEAEGSLQGSSGIDEAHAKEALSISTGTRRGPCSAPACGRVPCSAGLDEAGLRQVTEYADAFGVAFQIVDDLLDIEGDARELGKNTGSDERKGKLTYPALYGMDESRRMAKEQVQRAVAALAPFGESAWFLRRLAEYVFERKH